MEQQAKNQRTKKFFKSIFTPNSSKKTSISPQEWTPSTPSFDALDISHTVTNRRSNEDVYHSQHPQHHSSMVRSSSIQRRYSFSNVHESGQRRLLAQKRAEYQEKMAAFDDLIQRRRGSTLRLALAPDVVTSC